MQSRSGGASGFSLLASLWGLRGVVSGYSRARSRRGVLPEVLVFCRSSWACRVQSVQSHASGRKHEVLASCFFVAKKLQVLNRAAVHGSFLDL
ncbi:hypothetical protein NDU88_000368 [Pleurodeles waltl]|uniref:Secreted protein n=1 Tax=Pleurodeles waltl TaxID=8319 RepID=A0AAV7S5W5_PLEWA|nr:hypothetical protein NDU88_000368 [Pleurodeles waltl]